MVDCGDVWWFWWFAVVCGGLSFSQKRSYLTESEKLS